MSLNATPWEGWEIVRVIGKGAFGKVYEIHRNSYGFQERAAMKVLTIPQDEEQIESLRAEGLDEESITQTFHGYVGDIVREYRLMLGLKNCPNAVHVDDFKVIRHQQGIGWNVYIKMELLTPLMKTLDSASSESDILKLAKDLCNALVACQKQNILHRDIKPQNIFLSDDGNWKIGDFGISKSLDHTTHATVGVGTYSYMAPEVLLGSPYGPQADIYSLGMVLYWLLNRRRLPFLPLPPENYTASMAEEARRRRFRGEPLNAPADGSNGFKQVVLKACAFEPKLRYASAQEMLQDLIELDEDIVENQIKRILPEDATVVVRKVPVTGKKEGRQKILYEDPFYSDGYTDETEAEDDEEEDCAPFGLSDWFELMKNLVHKKKFLVALFATAIAAFALVGLMFYILYLLIL